MKALRYLVPAVSVIAAAVAVACGGDSEATDTATETVSPRATVTARASAPTPSATAAGDEEQGAPTETPQVAATATPQSQQPGTGAPTNAPPAPAPTNTPVPPPAPVEPQSLTIIAKNARFSPSDLTAGLGAQIVVTFDNQDAGIAHDLIIYTPAGGVAGQTSVISGPSQATLTFTPSSAGNYFFKCSLHPVAMTGKIVVS